MARPMSAEQSVEGTGTSVQEPETANQRCQIQSVAAICEPEGHKEMASLPFRRRLRLALRRHMHQRFKRTIKKTLTDLVVWWHGTYPSRRSPVEPSARPASLKAGDWVRVQSRAEIQATLNPWNELKGCAFMSEMLPYWGTTQRVLRPVERFVDERNYRVKKARGIVLLDGVVCRGTDFYGHCDRSCLFFWREQWLRKIDAKGGEPNPL